VPNPLKVILDANIWVSMAMGKRISKSLEQSLISKKIQIISCHELLEEVLDVASRPSLADRINKERQKETEDFIRLETMMIPIGNKIKICRDPDDDYLINLAVASQADFIVTGDKDLLVLDPYEKTRIILNAEFKKVLDKLD
jgi:uncharacterized protein